MPNKVETSIHSAEMHQTPEGIPVETYADGKIKVYGGHNPKTTIDIPEFNTHVTIHKFGPFEFNKENEVDNVLVRKGHHKSKLAIAFSDREHGGPYEYDVWSPEGIIGFAYGKRLDLLIGSLFYDDPKLDELIKDTGMDNYIQRHLKFAIITVGNRMQNS